MNTTTTVFDCVLRLSGAVFDPDSFIRRTGLRASKVWRVGEPADDGLPLEASGVTIGLCSDFSDQSVGSSWQDVVVTVLDTHYEAIRDACEDGGAQGELDLAVESRNYATTLRIATSLVRRVSTAGLGMSVSIYAVNDPVG